MTDPRFASCRQDQHARQTTAHTDRQTDRQKLRDKRAVSRQWPDVSALAQRAGTVTNLTTARDLLNATFTPLLHVCFCFSYPHPTEMDTRIPLTLDGKSQSTSFTCFFPRGQRATLAQTSHAICQRWPGKGPPERPNGRVERAIVLACHLTGGHSNPASI